MSKKSNKPTLRLTPELDETVSEIMARTFNEMREEAGVTFREIEAETGVPLATLSDLSSGRSTPRIAVVVVLGRFFNRSLGNLEKRILAAAK